MSVFATMPLIAISLPFVEVEGIKGDFKIKPMKKDNKPMKKYNKKRTLRLRAKNCKVRPTYNQKSSLSFPEIGNNNDVLAYKMYLSKKELLKRQQIQKQQRQRNNQVKKIRLSRGGRSYQRQNKSFRHRKLKIVRKSKRAVSAKKHDIHPKVRAIWEKEAEKQQRWMKKQKKENVVKKFIGNNIQQQTQKICKQKFLSNLNPEGNMSRFSRFIEEATMQKQSVFVKYQQLWKDKSAEITKEGLGKVIKKDMKEASVVLGAVLKKKGTKIVWGVVKAAIKTFAISCVVTFILCVCATNPFMVAVFGAVVPHLVAVGALAEGAEGAMAVVKFLQSRFGFNLDQFAEQRKEEGIEAIEKEVIKVILKPLQEVAITWMVFGELKKIKDLVSKDSDAIRKRIIEQETKTQALRFKKLQPEQKYSLEKMRRLDIVNKNQQNVDQRVAAKTLVHYMTQKYKRDTKTNLLYMAITNIADNKITTPKVLDLFKMAKDFLNPEFKETDLIRLAVNVAKFRKQVKNVDLKVKVCKKMKIGKLKLTNRFVLGYNRVSYGQTWTNKILSTVGYENEKYHVKDRCLAFSK